MRFVRRYLRGAAPALFFAVMPERRIGLGDLGFERVAADVYARGFERHALAPAAFSL